MVCPASLDSFDALDESSADVVFFGSMEMATSSDDEIILQVLRVRVAFIAIRTNTNIFP
jgi:hypothetical protein